MLRGDTQSDGKKESMFPIRSLEEGPVLVGGAEGSGVHAGRSDRGQHSLEGLEIPEGTQEAIHQCCPKNEFSQKRSGCFSCMLFSFLPEDACGKGS